MKRKIYTKIENYMVYTVKDGRYTFERSCGTERRAKERVRELKERGIDSLYTTELIEGVFY